MSSIQLLIVEDDFFVAEEIEASIQTIGFTVSARVDNGNDAIQSASDNLPDLAIMDIHIKGDKDGVETGRILGEKYNIPIIYLTDKSDAHTFERAKSTFPHAFISKPINALELKRSIELALNKAEEASAAHKQTTQVPEPDNKRFMIKDKGVLHAISPNEIEWLKADGSYCELKTTEKKITFSKAMKAILESLSEESYCRNHLMRIGKSSTVNIEKIDRIEGNKVIIGEEQLSIGPNYREDLLARFQAVSVK
jgi:DNA-binding LytR/AlgR family response regulator